MASFIELIAKIKQKNNGTFKLVDAQDVECEDGKGLDEVLNEKLDKNLGAENINKVLVTDAEGNVVTQDKEDFEGGGTGNYNDLENKPTINGVELSGNKTSNDLKMYTQEEVNYLLDDKMDKPYFDIAITDDTTIENTLAGNFKIDSIEGNIYQAEESDIVPTPERPIPIRSKKITVDGEIVELRSLKESVNIWDNTNIASYDGEAIQFQGWSNTVVKLENSFINLKPNTKYAIKMDIEMVEAITDDTLTQFSLNKRLLLYRPSSNEFGLPSVSIPLGLYDNIMSNGEVQSTSATFTSPEDLRGVVIAGYTERWLDSANKQYCAIVKFKNIILVEGDLVPSSYVAPTVRDYKIVDHTTKTSKIVRNVGYEQKDFSTITPTTETDGRFRYQFALQNRAIAATTTGILLSNISKSNVNNIGDNIFYVTSGFANFLSINSDINENVSFQYQLETPTEESIPYVETDTSEVGLSWQDTTSPSPDIKSEIYEVDEINIKLVGENLLPNDKFRIGNEGNVIVPENGKLSFLAGYTLMSPINLPVGTYYFTRKFTDSSLNSNNEARVRDSVNIVSTDIATCTRVDETTFKIEIKNVDTQLYITINTPYGTNVTIYDIGIFKQYPFNYQPYQETSIQHTLSKPLRANKDGSVRDIIDIVNMQTIYKLKKDIFDGSQLFGSSDLGYTDTTRFNIKIDDFEIGSNKEHFIWCDKLKNKNGDIPNEEYIRLASGTYGRFLWFYIIKNRLNDISATSFREWLKQNPLTTIYQLETPITEPLEDELVEKLKTLKTFSPVTHVFVEGVVKPTLNAKYPKDIAAAQAQLEQKVLLMSETLTATQANLLLQGGQN